MELGHMRAPARTLLRRSTLVLALAVAPHALFAQDQARDTSKAIELAPITTIGRIDNLIGTAGTASEGHVGSADLLNRPLTREGELLETVPGVIVTQHSGDGKANQYFVRGFNLDHGTDFQTRIEGMPVNMPTHAHGQGYTDLNFLIPELVDYLDYRLGVYHADLGDFGSAGGAEFHLARRLHPFATVSAGENGLARLAIGGSRRVGGGDLLIGGEAKGYNGPWQVGEELRKFSGLVRYSWDRGSSSFSILAMAYHNQWNASDQIPLRAVEDGELSRFGQVDNSDGGHTQRYSLSGTWRHAGASSIQELQLFTIYSDLSLYSNFGYVLEDSVRGDQFNQRERRVVLGGNFTHTQPVSALGLTHVLKLGFQSRVDLIDGLGLFHTERRTLLGIVRQDDVRETGTGAFLEAESRWRPWFRSVLGVRGDVYTFSVAGDRPENGGDRTAGIVSPKASLVFGLSPGSELYLSGGLGFHSNDARGTTITVDPSSGAPARRVDPLVRSRGAEIGVRVTPRPTWRSTLVLWSLGLNSELLFTGDGGTTEPSSASGRRGITWANYYTPIPQLALDADLSFSRARFTGVPGNQNHIPGALEEVVAAGITWNPKRHGPYGSIRLRHFGSYPLTESNSVRASATTLVNAEAGLLISGIRVQASVLNVLDAEANDIQYYYASRLPGEPVSGVNDVHIHPVEPRQVRVSLGWGL
jgi:hypothetical protein